MPEVVTGLMCLYFLRETHHSAIFTNNNTCGTRTNSSENSFSAFQYIKKRVIIRQNSLEYNCCGKVVDWKRKLAKKTLFGIQWKMNCSQCIACSLPNLHADFVINAYFRSLCLKNWMSNCIQDMNANDKLFYPKVRPQLGTTWRIHDWLRTPIS